MVRASKNGKKKEGDKVNQSESLRESMRDREG